MKRKPIYDKNFVWTKDVQKNVAPKIEKKFSAIIKALKGYDPVHLEVFLCDHVRWQLLMMKLGVQTMQINSKKKRKKK